MKLHHINKINFNYTRISARDIFKKQSYYIEKEISESYEIVKKTIDNNFFSSNSQKELKNFSNKILHLIKKKKLTKIIITGMGTTFTAAQAISFFFNDSLNTKYKYLSIKAILASEGSISELRDDMSDTLLIVVAQSGTTRDTNVFAELSKQRGCLVISFLNKRYGDIYFIAHKTFYIGDSRDVEMSVPSTKTYHAHVILGFIFLLQILKKTNKKIFSFAKYNFYKKYSKFFFSKKLNKMYEFFSQKKNWYILYDEDLNRVLAAEGRIKFSECCYKSTAIMSVEKFIELKIKNSILVFLCETNLTNKKKIKQLLKNHNKVICISNKKFYINKKSSFNFIQINLFYKNNLTRVISKILVLQLLSYSLAKYLNSRSIIFKKLSEFSIADLKLNKKKILKKITGFHSIFLASLFLKKLNIFLKNNKFNKAKLLSFKIFQKLSRPIDTVMHQAKTITVGTNRANSFALKKKTNFFDKFLILNNNSFKKKNNQKVFVKSFFASFKNNCNFKILHDLKNHNNAIILSEFFASEKHTAFAVDNIENHKHVDISSEPLIIVLLSFENSEDFVLDAISEFESMISHNNKIFLITDQIDVRYLKVFKKNSIFCRDNSFFNKESLIKFFQ